MRRECLDVFGLVETFLERKLTVVGGAKEFSIMNPHAGGPRPPGGTTVLVRSGVAADVMHKDFFRRTELVAV